MWFHLLHASCTFLRLLRHALPPSHLVDVVPFGGVGRHWGAGLTGAGLEVVIDEETLGALAHIRVIGVQTELLAAVLLLCTVIHPCMETLGLEELGVPPQTPLTVLAQCLRFCRAKVPPP